VNDRLLLIKIKTYTVNVIVIQVYFPTSNIKNENEQMYDSKEEFLRITQDSKNIIIIMSDFNAVIGERKDNQIVGKPDFETRNNRCDRIVNFCKQNNLLVTNTIFEVPKRRCYT